MKGFGWGGVFGANAFAGIGGGGGGEFSVQMPVKGCTGGAFQSKWPVHS